MGDLYDWRGARAPSAIRRNGPMQPLPPIPDKRAPKGSRPPMVRDNRHDSAHLFGAICPERGVGAATVMPAVNTEAMNEHPREISAQVA
jgi:hypothetical protein